jgi:RNA polymerase sigma-70 factor (ECF subfamily)
MDLQAIYEAHFDAVWHHLRRMGIASADRDDLAQEVFLVVHRKLASFDRSRPMRPWLIGICARVVLHYWRSARRHPVAVDREAIDTIGVGNEGDREARRVLGQLLATLDPERRAEFVLHELEGFSVPEIAELTETPVNTVYSRLRRTREELALLAQRWHGKAAS